MITNADITLYSYDKDSKGYKRRLIRDVFWSDSKQSNVTKAGMVDADAVKILIPESSVKGKLVFTLGRDLIVKGSCAMKLDFVSDKDMSEKLKALKADYRVVTVSIVDEKLYGGKELRHYKLSCK